MVRTLQSTNLGSVSKTPVSNQVVDRAVAAKTTETKPNSDRKVALAVNNLTKKFGQKIAVNDLSFEVKGGSFFAFLGQNGAGKTTTINMSLGLINPDLGNIKYLGDLTLAEFKSKIGVVFQNNVSDDLLKPKEILLLFAKIVLTSESQAKQRVDEIVEALKMSTFMNRQFKYLSGGEKRKTEIARALLGSPELLFLDEPTTGLDPKTRAEVWDLLNQIRTQKAMTIFLTTHYMEEVAEADQVVIIHQGQLIAQGSPAELKLNFSQDSLLLTPIDPSGLERSLTDTGFDWAKVGDSYRINSDSVSASINLLTSLRDNLKSFEVSRGDMDDVFLNAVGEQISEGI